MKKAIAIIASLAALAYVGLAYANEDEGGNRQENNWEQQKEQKKRKFEQERESLKQEWEKAKEESKKAREKFKNEFGLRLEEKKKLREEFRNKFTEERCAKIQERVLERASYFDNREGKHKKVYVNLVNRINKFISRFKAAGLDTTRVEGYLAELQTKINTFKTDYTAYITKLKESRNLTCGHSEGEFRSILVDTKTLLKVVHADAAEIRKYVRTVILPEIKVLKAQMPKEQDDENKDESEDNGEILKSVSIISPANNTTYSAAATVSISAKVKEDENIDKVEFYDGTTLKGTDTTKPYSYSWVITASDNGSHSWTTMAYDKASPANSVVSSAVNLTVAIPTP